MANLELVFGLVSAVLITAAIYVASRSTKLRSLPEGFGCWLREVVPNDPVTVDYGALQRELQNGGKTGVDLNAMVEGKCKRALRNNKSFDLMLSNPFKGTVILSANESFRPVTLDTTLIDKEFGTDSVCHARVISLRNRGGDLVVNGLSIGRLSVGPEFQGRLHVMNSRIRKLVLVPTATKRPSVTIENSSIGALDLGTSSCRNFTLQGGVVEHVVCCAPTEDSPFGGTVVFEGKPVLRTLEGRSAFSDPQQYRNLSMQLMKQGNVVAAKYAQIFEKRMERPHEPGTIRFVSLMYDALSMYGNSPGRALGWLLALLIYTAALFFILDGAVVVQACEGLAGWKQSLCDDGAVARVMRSGVIAFDAAVNPFGLFSKSHVVEARSIGLNVYLFVVGFFSIALIAQIGIGIRRRFISQ